LQLYVINLDRSVDRLAHITAVFTELGLDFTRVPAIDGKALTSQEFASVTQVRNWPLPLTRPEVGCFLSHRRCLAMGLKSGAPYFAIFEDDIKISPHGLSLLQNYDWIRPGVDIVKIDTANIDCGLDSLQKTPFKPYRLGRLVSKHYCTGGYIISRNAAIKLLEITQQAFAPIDEIYFNPDCGILQTLNVQQLMPAMVIQVDLKSTIRHDTPPHSGSDTGKRRHRDSGNRQHRPLTQKIVREAQRFYHRRWQLFWRSWRLFWRKWIKGYYWGKIPFH